jgi:hypothetical protein
MAIAYREGLVEETKIKECGLRYASKAPGFGDFGYIGSAANAMSCFKCGKHIPRSQGMFRRLIGASRFVCIACPPKN